MKSLSPKISSELACDVYGINKHSKTNLFFQRPEFVGSAVENQRISATVGGQYFKTSVGFGSCVRGAGQYKDDLFLIFRGSSTNHCGLDWLSNVRFGVGRSITGLPVHIGFNEIFFSMRSELEKFIHQHRDVSVVHCIGHSSGGAVAALVADWLHTIIGKQAILYSFGAPKTGVEAFAKSLTYKLGGENIHRVYHSSDPVAMVPAYPFTHSPTSSSGYQIPFQGAGVNHASHSMFNYKNSLSRFRSWRDIYCPLVLCNDESQVERWLRAESRVSPHDPQTWEWINASLVLVIKKVLGAGASILQLPFVASLTLADRASHLLLAGLRKAFDLGVLVVFLMQKIMSALGMNVVNGQEEMTYMLMHNVLTRVMNKITAEAKQAISCMDVA